MDKLDTFKERHSGNEIQHQQQPEPEHDNLPLSHHPIGLHEKIELLHLGLWEIGLDGKTLCINPTACSILEFDEPAEIVGMPYSTFFSKENLRQFERFFHSQEAFSPFRFEIIGKKGTHKTIVMAGMPLMLDSAQVHGILFYFYEVKQNQTDVEAIFKECDLYRTIVETTSEGIWIINAAEETVFVNDNLCHFLGYSPHDMIGKPISSFINKEEINFLRKKLFQRQKGVWERYDYQLRHKNGSYTWAIVSASPIMDSEKNYWGSLAMVMDITDRKQKEQELHETNTLLEKTFDSLNEAVLVIDPANRSIVKCNSAVESIFGYSMDELAGKNT